jgi:type II pantothenate kinase
MEPFCKLSEPEHYVATDWDLSVDAHGRRYWVDLFKRHFELVLKMGSAARVARGEDPTSVTRCTEGCREMLFARFLEPFDQNPVAVRARTGPVTILTLDRWRDDCLKAHDFHDAFIDLKARENEQALALLPMVCRQLDVLEGEAAFRAVVEGVFAGNIFDMGSEATAKAFLESGPDFFATRERLPPRPWLIDDYEALAKRMMEGPRHRKAVFFIDNAGSDFMLGVLPMMRWLARRRTAVVLAANERPTLNDMTVHEVRAWWPRILEAEPSIGGLEIEPVSTGTGEPLIDLSGVSAELNRAAADADLVILEGMGRGVESNLKAAFICDSLQLAMLKDEAVARRCGGKLFDVVCRFQAQGYRSI